MITFCGFALSIIGWFVWNLFICAIYPLKFGPYIVRGAFLHEFGNKLGWWAAAGATIVAVLAFELGATALQRIYFPRDEHLWQEIEGEGGVSEVLKEHAAEEGRAAPSTLEGDQHDYNDVDLEQHRPLSPVMSAGSSGGDKHRGMHVPPSRGAGAHGPVAHKGKRVLTA